jgi:transposase
MNRKNFENWFKTELIPKLEEPSLIIMDNASYHSGLQV